MKYNDLKAGKYKSSSRKGRGIAAGRGKTAGRGTKGQGARKSGGVRPGFEGGQMPLYMRIPKLRGFKSHADKIATVYIGDIQAINKTAVGPDEMAEAGYIDNPYVRVKIIAKGELKKKVSVKAQFCSKGAQEAIKAAGGSFERIERMKRPKKEGENSKK
jgi:large subunit ribosomal protein L15